METNTDTEKRPMWKEVNDEQRARAKRVFELIDSLESANVDEWEKRRLAEIRDEACDTSRIYSSHTVRVKTRFGIVRICTYTSSATHGARLGERRDDGALVTEWQVSTNVELDLHTDAHHTLLAAELVKFSAIIGGLAAAFEQKAFVVVEETADEAAARIAAEKAERERNAKNKILASAITLAGRGMRTTSQPRAIPLQILEGVPEGKHSIDLDGKSYTVHVGPNKATLDRTR